MSDCPPILPELHMNAIGFALEGNESVSKTISESYQHDEQLYPIIQRMQSDPVDSLYERYYWNEQSQYLYLRASPNNCLCVPM